MVCITNLVVTLFILGGSSFGISSGFSISSRDSKSSVLLSPSSLSETSSSSSTEHSVNENDSTNTQFVLKSEEHQHQKDLPTTHHHVPLDSASATSGTSNSNVKAVSVVKREVSSAADEAGVNGMYDPGLVSVAL